MGELFTERTWQSIIDAIYTKHAKIEVPSAFKERVQQIDILLDNDYTGVVKTVYDFMIGTANTNFTFVTDNENLTNMLTNWSMNELNRNVNLDIPKGLRDLSTQYFRERWRSSFIVLNIVWDKIDGYILPSRMWFSDPTNIIVSGKMNKLDGKEYYFGKQSPENKIISNDNKSVFIRKPFDSIYKNYATPYLVGRGVLYNSQVKESLIKKQADILEEIIPYLLLLKAGDANLLQKNMLTNLDSDLEKLKDSLKKYKRDHTYRTQEGDSILKGRYDLTVEHFIPELGKIFNDSIVKPVNWNILAGLGLIELEGFSTSRQEAIWNPKVLVEEVVDAVLDWQLLLEEVVQLIIQKNSSLHRKQMNKDIRIVPGVLKAFMTDAMKKLVKDYANTGQLAVEDSFEALPFGFDFEISRKRRIQERDRGDEDLFFPRVILNQNSDDYPTRPNITPNEIPKKKKKEEDEEAKTKDLEAPYSKNSDLPKSVKVLPQAGQTLWRKIFNQSLANGDSEDVARKKAWAGVKRVYKRKDDGTWVKAIKASTIDELDEEIKAILTIPEQIKIIKEE